MGEVPGLGLADPDHLAEATGDVMEGFGLGVELFGGCCALLGGSCGALGGLLDALDGLADLADATSLLLAGIGDLLDEAFEPGECGCDLLAALGES